MIVEVHQWKGKQFHFAVIKTSSDIRYPPLVFLGGAMQTVRSWTYSVAHFRNIINIVLVDLPGCGSSDRLQITGNEGRQFQVEALKHLLDRMGLDGIHLLGASYGALIALRFALCYPKLVKTLVLPGLGLGRSPKKEYLLKALEATHLGDRVKFCQNISLAYQNHSQRERIAKFDLAERLLLRTAERISDTQKINFVDSTERLLTAPVSHRDLKDLTVKTLSFTGEMDDFTPSSALVGVGMLHFKPIPGTDHLCYLTDCGTCNYFTQDFIGAYEPTHRFYP